MYGRLFNKSILVSDLIQHLDAVIYGHFEPSQKISLLCDLSQGGELTETYIKTQDSSNSDKKLISSALGICLKANYLKYLSHNKPFFLLSYIHYLEQIKQYYDDSEGFVLILIKEKNMSCDMLIAKTLRFIEQQQTHAKGQDQWNGNSVCLESKIHSEWLQVYPSAQIHPSAQVHPSAQLSARVSIGAFVVIEANVELAEDVYLSPYCYVGESVKVGANTHLEPRVTLLKGTVIGKNTRIHSGAVIGSEGFGLDDKGQLPHWGQTQIGDRVRVGALTCIDRATIGSTIIHNDVKLDNLIQIGHNVQIGSHSVICAQSGLAGSVKLGKQSILGGQVGIAQGVTVSPKTSIAAKSGVTKSLKQTGVYSGYPAEDNRKRLQREALLRSFLKQTEAQSVYTEQTGFDHSIENCTDQQHTPPHFHSSAYVHPSARVHPTAIIGKEVIIEADCVVEAYAVIGNYVSLGKSCSVASFAVIGAEAQVQIAVGQDADQRESTLRLMIGEYNRFCEGVTISRPTEHYSNLHVGDRNLFMAYSHLGHDCIVANDCVFANRVSIAGHVKVADRVQVGGHAAIHQFVSLGRLAFVAANAMVNGDVPAFCLVAGDRASLRGLNIVGLRRAQFDRQQRLVLKKAYRRLVNSNSKIELAELLTYLGINHDHALDFDLLELYESFKGDRRTRCKAKLLLASSTENE